MYLKKVRGGSSDDEGADIQQILQSMLDMVNTVKANKSNPAASPSRTSPEAAPSTDAKMEDAATSPRGVKKVSLSDSEDDASSGHDF